MSPIRWNGSLSVGTGWAVPSFPSYWLVLKETWMSLHVYLFLLSDCCDRSCVNKKKTPQKGSAIPSDGSNSLPHSSSPFSCVNLTIYPSCFSQHFFYNHPIGRISSLKQCLVPFLRIWRHVKAVLSPRVISRHIFVCLEALSFLPSYAIHLCSLRL